MKLHLLIVQYHMTFSASVALDRQMFLLLMLLLLLLLVLLLFLLILLLLVFLRCYSYKKMLWVFFCPRGIIFSPASYRNFRLSAIFFGYELIQAYRWEQTSGLFSFYFGCLFLVGNTPTSLISFLASPQVQAQYLFLYFIGNSISRPSGT